MVGDQLVPVNSHGRRYVVLRSGTPEDWVFIYPVEDSTVVNIGNDTTLLLRTGGCFNYHLVDTVTLITSDKPVEVFQILSQALNNYAGKLGGCVLPNMECMSSQCVMYTSHSFRSNTERVIMLVVETAHIGGFRINGSSNNFIISAADFRPVPGDSTLSWCKKGIARNLQIEYLKVENTMGGFALGFIENYQANCNFSMLSEYATPHNIRIRMDSTYCVGEDIVFNYEAPNISGLTLKGPNGFRVAAPPFVIDSAMPEMSGWYRLEGIDTANCLRMVSDSIYISVGYSHCFHYFDSTVCSNDMPFRWNGIWVDSAGTYMDTLVSARGGDSIVVMTFSVDSTPVLQHIADTSIMEGNPVALWASGAYYVTWGNERGGVVGSGDTHTVSPPRTTRYTVSGYNQASPSRNLVDNGDFEQGNVGFLSSYTNSSVLYIEGNYYVGTNAIIYYGAFSNMPDHTTGSGNYMIVNGANYANSVVWTQTIAVNPHTNYVFSVWVCSVGGGLAVPSNMARLQIAVNYRNYGTEFDAPSSYGVWSRHYVMWNSGNSTSAVIEIIDINGNREGNDFGIDDIEFYALSPCSVTDTIKVDVTRYTYIDSTVCSDDIPLMWHGITIDSAGTYADTLSYAGGSDSIVVLNVTVVAAPVLQHSADTLIRAGGTVALWASGANVVTWYDESGTIVGRGDTLTVSPPRTTRYVVVGSNELCGDTGFVTVSVYWQADTSVCLDQLPVVWNGVTIYGDSTVWKTLSDGAGRDSLVMFTLHVIQSNTYLLEDTVSVCRWEAYRYRDSNYYAPSFVEDSLQSIQGCDSVVRIWLEIHDSAFRADGWLSDDSVVWHRGDREIAGCQPVKVWLRDSSADAAAVVWHFGDGTSTTEREASHVYNRAGVYTIMLEAVSGDGCRDTAWMVDAVQVMEQQRNNFYWEPLLVTIMKPEADFVNLTQPDDSRNSYKWFFLPKGGGQPYDSIFGRSPHYRWTAEHIAENDWQDVMLASERQYTTLHQNTLLCFDTMVQTVHIANIFLQFPNVVTANGDGVNDRWCVVNLVEYGYWPINRLRIYNRWGKLVFSRDNITSHDDDWDPAAENRPTGTYFFHFEAQNEYGHTQHNGVIEVLR